MSAQSLDVVTLVFPNPYWHSTQSSGSERVNSSISFTYLSSFDLQTLSATDASPGQDVTGLLYVPDLASDDPCINTSAPYVPANVTRRANLPNVDYDLIAIAPWLTANCTLNYLAAARGDPVKGFLFFLTNGNATATPPAADSEEWDLGDNGAWKSYDTWPVYAVPTDSGTTLMDASARYSGNMTDVPNGHELTEYYDSRDYVRLYVDIDTGGGMTTLPGLWVFLLVVLGIMLSVIGLASLLMHLLQRRRREALRRRVAAGEVDLEALGIKRMTVPQDILDSFPLYTYGTDQPAPGGVSKESIDDPQSTVIEDSNGPSRSRPSSSAQPPDALPMPTVLNRHNSYHPGPLSQPTCAICLDDFVSASPSSLEGTTVRELPCHHIFHPECVDTFLRQNSSLCPLCKSSALPQGYCPRTITNAMVQRERTMRRLRERILVYEGSHQTRALHPTLPDWLRSSRRLSGLPTLPAHPMTEIRSFSTSGSGRESISYIATSSATPAQRQPQAAPAVGRREWARRRAVEMLGQNASIVDADEEAAIAAQSRGRFQKLWRQMFPAIGR